MKQHGKRGPSDRRVDINSILSSSLSEGEKVTQLEAFFELIDDTDDIDDTKEDRDYYEKVYLPALRASEVSLFLHNLNVSLTYIHNFIQFFPLF